MSRVGRYGAAIRVWATDDVQVAEVEVLGLDEQGKTEEKGSAIQARGDWWEYVPTTTRKVIVEVRDPPGNRGNAELSVVSHATDSLAPSVDFDRRVSDICLSETWAKLLENKI